MLISPTQSLAPVNLCSFCGKDVPVGRKTLCSRICSKRKYKMKRCKTSRFKDVEGYERTETGISVKWEQWFVEKFGGKWMNEEIMGAPYDVEWNNKKIDVKASTYFIRPFKRGKVWNGGGTWTFQPNPTLKPEIDHYACICIKEGVPVKCLLIPAIIYDMRKGLTVGKVSQFDNYNIL